MRVILALIVAPGFALSSASEAAAATARSQHGGREDLSCSACHVGDDGGPLTGLGRQYRWRMSPFDVADDAGDRGASDDDGPATPPSFGRWSGEASLFGRTGRTRVFGERASMLTAIETLRLHGGGLFGDDQITFDGEGFSREGHNTLDGGVGDDDAGLTSAQLTWRSASDGTFARLGRQFVIAGAATRRVDGLDLRTPLGSSSDVELFGGLPSDRGFGGARGDFIAGGRVGTKFGDRFGVGASGFYAKDAADPADAKGGLDLQWSPLRHVDLSGHVYYDWIADRIYDGRVRGTWAPSLDWQVAADWTHAVPALFLPKDSIFWVFSVDAYEESALTVTRRFDQRRSANVFARHTTYESGDHLDQLGGGLDVRYGPNGEDTVGGELAWQDEERSELGGSSTDGDVLYLRAYHQLWWTEAIYTALDGSVQFVTRSSGRDATLLRLAAGYDPHRSWDFEVGLDWRRDPDFEDVVGAFARVRVRF